MMRLCRCLSSYQGAEDSSLKVEYHVGLLTQASYVHIHVKRNLIMTHNRRWDLYR